MQAVCASFLVKHVSSPDSMAPSNVVLGGGGCGVGGGGTGTGVGGGETGPGVAPLVFAVAGPMNGPNADPDPAMRLNGMACNVYVVEPFKPPIVHGNAGQDALGAPPQPIDGPSWYRTLTSAGLPVPSSGGVSLTMSVPTSAPGSTDHDAMADGFGVGGGEGGVGVGAGGTGGGTTTSGLYGDSGNDSSACPPGLPIGEIGWTNSAVWLGNDVLPDLSPAKRRYNFLP